MPYTHKDQQDAKVPRHSFLAQVKTAGSEPLFQEADPHILKLAIEARMYDKDGPKNKKAFLKLNLFYEIKL